VPVENEQAADTVDLGSQANRSGSAIAARMPRAPSSPHERGGRRRVSLGKIYGNQGPSVENRAHTPARRKPAPCARSRESQATKYRE
jgi:hypothetical protein